LVDVCEVEANDLPCACEVETKSFLDVKSYLGVKSSPDVKSFLDVNSFLDVEYFPDVKSFLMWIASWIEELPRRAQLAHDRAYIDFATHRKYKSYDG
jgi:hypothetical protein